MIPTGDVLGDAAAGLGEGRVRGSGVGVPQTALGDRCPDYIEQLARRCLGGRDRLGFLELHVRDWPPFRIISKSLTSACDNER